MDWSFSMADNRDSRQRQPRVEEPKEFEEVVINIDRVSRVVKGGRRFRFKALVVVGDKKKRVGIGVSKGTDVQTAVMKATSVAKKNVVEIPIFKTTIPHEVNAKVGGARVLLMPASPGTGIIAGGTVRAIINVTGINNLLSKSLGSTNKVNAAYATIEALMQLRSKDQWVTTELENTKAAATKAKKSTPAKDETTKVVAKKPAKKVAKKTEGTK
jgi:small subunit ribosomal protein S5